MSSKESDGMYRVNEIFYSLQGEGYHTGRAAVFIRFAGCNLRCPFCDTDFDSYTDMTAEQILAAISDYPSRFVVLTGGEPTLQVTEPFIDLLHQHGYEVAMESNGTRPAPKNLDWLTVSPKNIDDLFGWIVDGDKWMVDSGLWIEDSDKGMVDSDKWIEDGEEKIPNEIKLVFDEDTPAKLSSIHYPPSTIHQKKSTIHKKIHHPPSTIHQTIHLFLQPCDTGDPERNKRIVHDCIEYIKKHPKWRLSLQTHKLTGIQ
jgi:organic radical activating enzyme